MPRDLVHRLFLLGQKIQQQRRKTSALQDIRNIAIAPAMAAASTPVREKDRGPALSRTAKS